MSKMIGIERSAIWMNPGCEIHERYQHLAWYFDLWVRVFELQTRLLEADAVSPSSSVILNISPPTDPGLRLISKANRAGDTHLFCFSEAMKEKALTYRERKSIEGLNLLVAPFFSIPLSDTSVDSVMANCFFDFLVEETFEDILREIHRVLRPGGRLFAVYMDKPKRLPGRLWKWLFRKLTFLSQGCHPVDILPYAEKTGFITKTSLSLIRFGFPLRYLVLERQ